MREKCVSVALVYNPTQGFWVDENVRWNGLAFPIRDLDPSPRLGG